MKAEEPEAEPEPYEPPPERPGGTAHEEKGRPSPDERPPEPRSR